MRWWKCGLSSGQNCEHISLNLSISTLMNQIRPMSITQFPDGGSSPLPIPKETQFFTFQRYFFTGKYTHQHLVTPQQGCSLCPCGEILDPPLERIFNIDVFLYFTHWQTQGHHWWLHPHPANQTKILSFWHIFSPKSTCSTKSWILITCFPYSFILSIFPPFLPFFLPSSIPFFLSLACFFRVVSLFQSLRQF